MRTRRSHLTIGLLACLMAGGIWGVARLSRAGASVGPGLVESRSTGDAAAPDQQLALVGEQNGEGRSEACEAMPPATVSSGAIEGSQGGSAANGLVAVRLLERASGLPAQGVRVSILYGLKKSIGFSERLGSSGQITDETGHVDVPFAAPPSGTGRAGDPLMTFQGEGYSTAVRWYTDPTAEHGKRRTYFVDRSAEIYGRVSLARPPLGGRHKVRLRKALAHWPSGTSFYGSIHGEGWIGVDGVFRIKNVPPGQTFDMEIVVQGKVLWAKPAGLELRSGEVREVNWSLTPGTVRVHGIEQDHGAPEHFRVRLGPAPIPGAVDPGGAGPRGFRDLAFADSHGVATFEGVLPGRWRATVVDESRWGPLVPGAQPGEPAAPSFVDFEVGAGAGIVDVDLPIYRGAYIVGTISLGAEDHLPRLRLCATGNGGTYAEPDPHMHVHGRRNRSPSYRRHGDRFRLGPLMPGEYELRLSENSDRGLCIHPATVAVTGGEPVRVEVRRGGRLRLSVVDGATGVRPADRVTVRLLSDAGSRELPLLGSTTIEGLSGQPFVMLASANDGKVAAVRHPGVEPGETASPIIMRLREPAKLQLMETPGDRWTHIAAFRFGARLASAWIPPGSMGELRVGAGELEIVYSVGDGDGFPREIGRGVLEVKPGEVASLTLPPG